MSIHINLYSRRTDYRYVDLRDANNDLVTIEPTDIVRISIGRASEQSLLQIASNAATAKGSNVTAENPALVIFDEDDIALDAGIYDIDVTVNDAGDGNRLKHAEQGILAILEPILQS